MLLSLSHPEYFTVTGPDGQAYRGADQDWYPLRWQRRAGCGPTTAATILGYLAQSHFSLAPMVPGDLLAHMEALWSHATPGARGLDRAENFVLGCRSFALSKGCVLLGKTLEIPHREKASRPSLETCRDFLAEALYADLPVAFLNYSSGSLDNLDNWHWVSLIGMEEEESGKLPCLILDGGEEKVIDFTQWLNTSTLGGALAVVYPRIELEE